MKKLPLILVISACALILITFRSDARQLGQKQVLVDFRVEHVSAPPRISAATQKAVLSKVFRKYLTDDNRCNANFESGNISDPLEAARKAGQIVPSIVDMATGSFTTAGQTQIAYVISVSECNASHADNFGTKRVAIFSGQQLVADMDVDFRGSIVRKTDLNGDGVDELILASDDMAQGTVTQTAALLSFERGRVRVVEDFGKVFEDSCASGMPGSGATASVVSVGAAMPGNMPKIRIENYAANCRKNRRWRFISTGKMPL